MSEAFLTNTSTEGLKPLGTAPQRSFELVSDTVREKLGPAHAALFAEPVPTQYGDRFDWYAPVSGRATLLADVPDPEAVRARLQVREGMPFSQNLVDRSVRSLYNTRLFDFIEARTEDTSGGQVRVIFTVQARYKISQISIEGNKKQKSKLKSSCAVNSPWRISLNN